MSAVVLLVIISIAFCTGAIVMAFICSGSHQDLLAENDRLREQLAPTYEYPSVSLTPAAARPVGLSVAEVITALGEPGHRSAFTPLHDHDDNVVAFGEPFPTDGGGGR